ncbi:MAG: ABC transporter substrate-binding protein [Blautia sp.]|nr:ABC transporter substrate-binding protein [Blautia sp.]MCM1202426.1 ABC transporter substrate-binding protein [Bacteroides fragilis]
MKKKVIATLLAGLLCVGMLSGCGGSSEAPADNASNTNDTGTADSGKNETVSDGEIYEVVIQFPTLGDTPQDLQMVEDALNEITEPEIGVHVTFYPSSAFELNNTTTMMVSSGEKLDLAMCMFEGGAQGYVNKGMLIELDDLVEEYGQDILAAEGKAMAGGYYNGTLYAVPTEEKMGRVKAFECRKDLLEKYNIEYDEEKVYTLEELTEIFKTVKEGEGDKFYCIAANASEDAPYTYFAEADLLGADYGGGVLMNYGKGTTEVVNYFESDEFAEYCDVMRNWFEEGYFSSDCNTITDSSLVQLQSGNYFGMFSNAEPDMIASHSASMQAYLQTDVVALRTTQPASRTQDYQVTQWMVPITCDNPEKTMQFLNMLYGRKDIVNLIYWGIEGTHYNRVEGTENMVEFPEGIDRSNTPYAAILNVWGDKLKDYVMEPNDDGYVAMMQEFNNSISGEYTSDALGYCFNSDPVKTQYAAVNDVVTQYAKSTLGYGVVDPGPQLEEFLSALDAAGIDEIIAENQKQFDEWNAAQ